ncbi:MAG: hypothetical protein HY202_06285 [Nitrospirae bacterium]|nr:hypothetical protein [Nitrospirota bacterium]
MKPKPIAILIFTLLLTLTGSIPRAETAALSLDDLARIFSTYFPRLEGTVLNINGSSGTVDLGGKNGLVKGMVLTVFRPGEPFYHPGTKEEMGRFEETIGLFELDAIGENESGGTFLISGQAPEAGDRVRISSARIPVAVTGESEKNNLVLMDEFSRFLLDTNRFLIPSFSKSKNDSGKVLKSNEPVYEFKIKLLPNQAVQVELVNKPFNHLIEGLTGSAGKLQE